MKFVISFLMAAWLLANPAMAGSKAVCVVGMPSLSKEGGRLVALEDYLKEAYSRIGVEVQFAYLPMLRELDHTCAHMIDASLARTKMAVHDNPNVVQVEFPIANTSLKAYSVVPLPNIDSLKDLHGLKVGVLRGDLTSTKILRDLHIQEHQFNTLQGGLNSLRQGRLDVLVTHPVMIELSGVADEFSTLHRSVDLHTDQFHHTLNRSHADLAEPLAQAFAEMLEDGTTHRLLLPMRKYLPTENPAAR